MWIINRVFNKVVISSGNKRVIIKAIRVILIGA